MATKRSTAAFSAGKVLVPKIPSAPSPPMAIEVNPATVDPPEAIPGRVILFAPEAGLSVTLDHLELPQATQEAAGGWSTIDRPTLRPMTTWSGPQARKLQLALRADGWLVQAPVETTLAMVRRLGDRLGGDAPRRPPWLRVVGAVPFPDLTWVIESLQIEEQLHDSTGEVMRAKVTIGLVEFVDPQVSLRKDAMPKAPARTHRWKRGDTLHKLAKRYLGSENRWKEIDRANPQVKRWSTLAVGKAIKIPPKG